MEPNKAPKLSKDFFDTLMSHVFSRRSVGHMLKLAPVLVLVYLNTKIQKDRCPIPVLGLGSIVTNRNTKAHTNTTD